MLSGERRRRRRVTRRLERKGGGRVKKEKGGEDINEKYKRGEIGETIAEVREERRREKE